jgi:hypothetical protein
VDAPPEGHPLVGLPLNTLDEIGLIAAAGDPDTLIVDTPRDPIGPHGVNQPGETDADGSLPS